MAINTGKVVVGGIAAAVVQNVLGFVGNGMILAPRMNAEMDAVTPGLSAKMMTGANIGMGLAGGLVIGLLTVWLYAAMRPRFGPGPKTATYAGLVIWLCGFVFYMGWLQVGMMTTTTYMLASLFALIGTVAGAQAGAWLYKEEG